MCLKSREMVLRVQSYLKFLFEFASINANEHVLRGRWLWKNHDIRLQWWALTLGAIQSRVTLNLNMDQTGGPPFTLVVTEGV